MLLWNTLVQLVPSNQLLSAQSPLHDITGPAATLAMALARAYACDTVFGATVMWQVLAASGFFVVAAVSGQAGGPFGGVAMTVRLSDPEGFGLGSAMLQRLACMQEARTSQDLLACGNDGAASTFNVLRCGVPYGLAWRRAWVAVHLPQKETPWGRELRSPACTPTFITC
jgi:hypothetical protein